MLQPQVQGAGVGPVLMSNVKNTLGAGTAWMCIFQC